ncbi:MAG: condensation domain-containing protein, partial [Rhodoferax sp.]
MQIPSFSLAELLQQQATRCPEAPAIVSIDDCALDYAGLWQQVQQLAAAVRSAGLHSSARVALVLPNGPEMAVAFLGVASCATCVPLNPACTAAEFRFFLEDTGVHAVLLLKDEQGPVRAVAIEKGVILIEIERSGGLDGRLHIVCGPLRADTALEFCEPDRVALILHTSGTTARPKIVPLTQTQLLASALSIAAHLALTPADRCLNVMPLFHIHGLVAALLASLRAGASVVCTPGFDQAAFFDWIARSRPTWTTAVPTLHQAWVERGSCYRQKAPKHRFRFLRSSSAALPPQTLRAMQALTGAPVVEAYGMTEASHQIASNPMPPGVCKPGSVGLPAGAEIAMMDEAGNLLEHGAVGEIVVRGPGVTLGYEDNPGANAEAFHDGWFRTGDQGRLDQDGYLFITGRLKEIVNRGGEKISPREIDEALLEHPAVLQAAAYAVPHPSLGEDLAAAVVLRADALADEAALRHFLLERLAPYKVPSTILLVEAIPKGSTGKVQRNRLQTLLAQRRVVEPVPPSGCIELKLGVMFADVLGTGPVGAVDNFFVLGGDSLKGMQVLAQINRHFGLALPATALFRHPSVRTLAREIEAALAEPAGTRSPAPKDDEAEWRPGSPTAVAGSENCAPLTPNQRGLWLLARLAPQSAAYNMTRMVSLRGPLVVLSLQRAFSALLQRHQIFRAWFSATEDQPLQMMGPAIEFLLPVRDLGEFAADQRQAQVARLVQRQAQTPFALDQCPLLRVMLLRLGEHEHQLVLTIHHIIADDWALGVIWRELSALYESLQAGRPSPLALLPMQYADHARRSERLTGDAAEQHLDYWRKALVELPVLALPTDRPRPLQPSHRGQLVRFSVAAKLTLQLRALSRTRGTTLFTTLLAAFQVLLHRHSAQEDFAVGVPVLGRPEPELSGLVGHFVNMLVIRADLSASPTFTELLARVQARTRSAYQRQDVPFDVLVRQLAHGRDPSRNPLFQVAFNKRSAEHQVLQLSGLEPAEIETVDSAAPVFDLSVILVERHEQLDFLIEYASDLFDASTIERMAGH